MTPTYFMAACWGLVLLVAFIGYGKLLRRLLFANSSPGWANEGAWGMALLVAGGGLLNYFRIISPTLILIIVLAGVLCSIFDVVRQKNAIVGGLANIIELVRKKPALAALKLLVYASIVVPVAILYLGSVTTEVHHANFIVIDDLRGYFQFPKQMLESGGMTADPFNVGRLGHGLGGHAILHAFILLFFDFYNILMIETGISLVLCAGLVWRLASDRGLGLPLRWFLTLFFLCLPYYPSLLINNSSFVSGILMLLALFAFLDRDDGSASRPVRNACMVALMTACAITLKTTFMPPVAVILVLSYLWTLLKGRFDKKVILETALVPVFIILILLPWMLSLYESSGTLLYPILGTGFDEYNYGSYLHDMHAGQYTLRDRLTIIYLTFLSRDIYLLLIMLGVVAFLLVKPRRRATAHVFAVGVLISSIIFLLLYDLTKLPSMNRYIYGVVYTALVVTILELLAEAKRNISAGTPGQVGQQPAKRVTVLKVAGISTALIGSLALFLFQYEYIAKSSTLYRFNLGILSEKMQSQGTFFDERWQARYQAAQQSVPAGATLLSRDIATTAYDFGRNTIYFLSQPGACSPPPGMPYFSGPEAISKYLLSHGVRYVAYTYANDGGLPISKDMHRIRPDAKYFDRIFQRAAIALSRAFNELGAMRKRLYDDGTLFVLDLQEPARTPQAYRPPNYFQAYRVLSPVMTETSGFDRNKVWTNGHGVIKGLEYWPDAKDRFLVLNTFGYHPWFGDINRLGLVVSVNGRQLPLVGIKDNSYYFSIGAIAGPITRITIDTTTFIPREQGLRFGKDDDMKTLGIDVDTIEIKASP